jgi:NAD(P)H-dependent flavin oxidoreductase YrpB (nitropropane dioxygenase family)
MPGIATPALALAVARAGGLGMLGAGAMPVAELERTLDELRAPGAVLGVNFLMPFLDRDGVAVAARAARVVEFFYGEPDRTLIEVVHRAGALASWQVGSASEAAAAAAAGCDLVVAQGIEAGGHIRGRIGLWSLLSQVLDTVSVPVIAAGGIATPRHLAAALAAGAAAVRMGTRFVAAAESGAHPEYVAALLRAESEDTVLTEAFSVLWPNAPHRVLRACVAAATECSDHVTGEVDWAGVTMPIQRFSVVSPTVHTRGAIHAMALYAGESVGAVHRVEPAADIIRELVDGAERLLRA